MCPVERSAKPRSARGENAGAALGSAAKQHGIVDRIDGPVGPDERRGVGFAGRGSEVHHERQRVGREVPAVDVTVLAIDDGALVGRVDRGRIDAPFANTG